MVWSTNSQDSIGSPCGARTGIVRAPHGNHQCFSYPTGPVRGPCGTRKGAVRQSCGHARELTQPELAKLPHGRRIWPYGTRTGPLRAPQGLFTGCLQYLNPYGARKLMMHALKLYGPRTGRQNSYVSGRTIFVQNSPGTARTGPGSVMWLRHNLNQTTHVFVHKGHALKTLNIKRQPFVSALRWSPSKK